MVSAPDLVGLDLFHCSWVTRACLSSSPNAHAFSDTMGTLPMHRHRCVTYANSHDSVLCFPLFSITYLQATLARLELAMASAVLDDATAMDLANESMSCIVHAWRHQEKQDDALKRKQAQAIEYKTSSHQVRIH